MGYKEWGRFKHLSKVRSSDHQMDPWEFTSWTWVNIDDAGSSVWAT
jgi:hypothetical protein